MISANRRIGLALFLLMLACYSYFFQLTGWNQTSRMALVMSVANQGTFTINDYQERTGDKAFYEGNYYSDKAFGTAMFGVPVYTFFSWLQDFDSQPKVNNDMRYPLYLVSVVVVALPSALLVVLLYAMLVSLIGSPFWSLILSLCYGLGSMAFPFATMLFGHQLASAFAFAAFFLLFQARATTPAIWRLFLAGNLVGLAVITEYQVVLIGAFLFFYAVTFVRPWHRLAFYILGGLPWAALMFGFNYITLGSPFRFAYQYVSNPDFAGMKTGVFGITVPQWSSFLQIMVGQQGLLLQSLFLLLLPLGIWQMWRLAQWRRELVLCVSIGVVFILWNSAYYLPLGGGTPGPRFLIPCLPFLMVPLAFALQVPRPFTLPVKVVLLLTGVWSVGMGFLISMIDPMVPFGIQNPYTEHWLDKFSRDQLLLNLGTVRFGLYGLMSLAPLLLLIIVAADTLFHAMRKQDKQHRAGKFADMTALVVLFLIVALPINLLSFNTVPFEFLRK